MVRHCCCFDLRASDARRLHKHLSFTLQSCAPVNSQASERDKAALTFFSFVSGLVHGNAPKIVNKTSIENRFVKMVNKIQISNRKNSGKFQLHRITNIVIVWWWWLMSHEQTIGGRSSGFATPFEHAVVFRVSYFMHRIERENTEKSLGIESNGTFFTRKIIRNLPFRMWI